VTSRLPESGVASAVTAVLLNFRAYDTLLEVSVLALAVAAVRVLRPGEGRTVGTEPLAIGPAPGPLAVLARFLAVMALPAAVYLWWAGASQPGGAFQAGTAVGAGLLMLMLAGAIHAHALEARWPRRLAAAGPAVFLGVGLWPLATGGPFLQYPAGRAGAAIVLVEAALTLAIGFALALLVAGPPPGRAPP
jgi:multisubunit Na+/H+ antiporter MnhB subunit